MHNFKIFIYTLYIIYIYIYIRIICIFLFWQNINKFATHHPVSIFPYPRFTQITASPEDILLSFLAGSFEASAVSIQLLLEGLWLASGTTMDASWLWIFLVSSRPSHPEKFNDALCIRQTMGHPQIPVVF